MSHPMHLGRSPSDDEGIMRSSPATQVSGPHAPRGPAPTEAALPQKEKQPARNTEPAPQPAMPQHGRA